MTDLPRILVGVTTYDGKDYIFHRCMEFLEKLDYPRELYDIAVVDNTSTLDYYRKLKRKGYKNLYHTLRGDNSREALTKSQNKLRHLCLEGGYDYLLFVESDLLVAPDTIKRLLGYNKPVVGSLYNIGRQEGQFIPCIFITHVTEFGFLGTRPLGVQPMSDGKKAYDPTEINTFLGEKGKIIKVHGCGLGCTLIRRELIEKFPFWCDRRFDDKHSDVYFYLDLQNNNIPVFVDKSVLVPHYPSDWSKMKDR